LLVTLKQDFLEGLKAVLGQPQDMIPLHAPEFIGSEWALVKDCLDSSFVSSVGRYVDQFEAALAAYTGARYAVAVVNGTAALQIGLLLAGVKSGDEVLIPALSFVATANAVSHCGGIAHFVDSEFKSMGMDPNALRNYLDEIAVRTPQGLLNKQTGRRIAAIVPMHTYGHAVNMSSLMEVSVHFGIPIVEDAAEALGSFYQGQHLGTFGLLGTLSFNGNKIITTGGGGAILTNDLEIAQKAKHLTTTAKQPHRWAFFHDQTGWNFRMPNLNAALGCAQLEQLQGFLGRKRELAFRYQRVFEEIQGLSFMSEPEGTVSNYWLNTVRLEQPDIACRDELLALANDSGYQCRPTWTLLHRLPMHGHCPRAQLTVAEQLEASLINLPSSARHADLPA
jgi:perosamine synthetase